MIPALIPVLILVVAACLLLIVGSVTAHAIASGPRTPPSGRTSVVVLGYPARRNGSPHPIQRWRCRLAVRTAAAVDADRIVFTGGNPTADRTEASMMAELADAYGLADVPVLLEDASISTWQNVAQTMALVSDARYVVVVSDPLHAARARSYWLRQQPQDDGRVYVTGQSDLLDHWWLKVPTAIHELVRALFDRTRVKARA